MIVVDREVNLIDADVVVARCAGLDVHRVGGHLYAGARPVGRTPREGRTFGTTTVRLLGLAGEKSKDVTHVAIQATGIY